MSKKEKKIKKLPKSIKVIGKKFRIHVLKPDEYDDAVGCMKLADQMIGIRPQGALGQMQDTALHETIHAVDESLALEMTETQVHQLAAGLLGVLKDNPEFTAWLIAEE